MPPAQGNGEDFNFPSAVPSYDPTLPQQQAGKTRDSFPPQSVMFYTAMYAFVYFA